MTAIQRQRIRRRRKVPTLRIIKLATHKIPRIAKLPSYRLRWVRVDGERLQVTVDWIFLRNASLKVEMQGFAEPVFRTFPLTPKVIYGRETEFFFCHFCWNLKELIGRPFRSKGRDNPKILLILWLEGISPLPPYPFVQHKIARLTIPKIQTTRHGIAMYFLSFLAVFMLTFSTLCAFA